MARRAPTNRDIQKLRAPRERALRKKIHDPGITLRNRFAQFAADRNLLEDMAREAAARELAEPSTSEKSIHSEKSLHPVRGIKRGEPLQASEKSIHVVHGIKRAEPIPEEVARLVEAALARSKGLFTALELELEAGLLSESMLAYEAGAGGVIRQVGLSGTFNLRNPLILDALASRANKLAGDVADTTFDAIKETIAREFFLEGRGVDEVARALQNEFDFLTAKRSSMIARTETGIVTEMGSFEQYAEVGIENKRWLSALVEQTRPGHRKANGQTVPLFEPFVVEDQDGNPEEMLHPMDPDASVGNVVNCLCASGPVIQGALRGPWLGE